MVLILAGMDMSRPRPIPRGKPKGSGTGRRREGLPPEAAHMGLQQSLDHFGKKLGYGEERIRETWRR